MESACASWSRLWRRLSKVNPFTGANPVPGRDTGAEEAEPAETP